MQIPIAFISKYIIDFIVTHQPRRITSLTLQQAPHFEIPIWILWIDPYYQTDPGLNCIKNYRPTDCSINCPREHQSIKYGILIMKQVKLNFKKPKKDRFGFSDYGKYDRGVTSSRSCLASSGVTPSARALCMKALGLAETNNNNSKRISKHRFGTSIASLSLTVSLWTKTYAFVLLCFSLLRAFALAYWLHLHIPVCKTWKISRVEKWGRCGVGKFYSVSYYVKDLPT